MKKILSFSSIALTVLLTAHIASAAYVWVGNLSFNDTRATSNPCQENLPIQNPITLDQWSYTRALVSGICFEVFAEGTTEYYRTDIENYLKIELYLTDSQNSSSRIINAKYVKHVGNNAVFYADLRDLNWLYSQTSSKNEVIQSFNVWDAANNHITTHQQGLKYQVHHTRY